MIIEKLLGKPCGKKRKKVFKLGNLADTNDMVWWWVGEMCWMVEFAKHAVLSVIARLFCP